MEQDPGDGGKKLKRMAPPMVQTPHVTREELKNSLSSLSSRLQDGFNATLGRATAELNSLVSTSVSESLQDLQQQVDARCAATEAEVTALKASAAQHEQRTSSLEARASANDAILQQLLQREKQRDKEVTDSLQRVEEGQSAIAQQVEQDVDRRLVDDPSYARPPNRTILRLGTQENTKITAVRDVCKTWLESTVAANLWSISGPDVGTDWTLSFLATPSAATTYASKARSPLIIGRGQWRKIWVTAESGEEGQLYISEDLLPKVARAQTATKRLVEIFKSKHADKRIAYVKPRYHPQRPIQGIVQIDGVDICAVKAESQYELPDRMQATGGRAVGTSMWCK